MQAKIYPEVEKKSMQALRQKSVIPWLVFLGLMGIALFLPMNYIMVHSHPHNDYKDHIQFARQLNEGQEMPAHIAAHPAWQVSLVLLTRLFNISLENSAVILQTGFDLLLVIILFGWLKNNCPQLSPGWVTALSLGVSIAAPLMLFAAQDGLFYLGYIGITSYHNPTIIMLRPFAVLIFLYCVGLMEGKRFSIWHILLSALFVILSALAKPNLLVCLLPALGILMFVGLLQHNKFDWRFALFGIFIPSVIVLAWQFLATYGGEEAGIQFAPLAVMKSYSGALLAKLILSIWFPLLVILAYWKSVWRDKSMQLAVMTFIFGAAFTYLLSEGAARFQDGNWGWSGEIALFLLFAASVIFFFKHHTDTQPAWLWKVLLWVGFVPHMVAGVVYYVYVLARGTFV